MFYFVSSQNQKFQGNVLEFRAVKGSKPALGLYCPFHKVTLPRYTGLMHEAANTTRFEW